MKFDPILPDSLLPFGTIRRTKGYSGEVVLSLQSPLYADIEADFLFLLLDGIPVPFRVEYFAGTSENFFAKFDRIDSDLTASKLKGVEALFSRAEYDKLIENTRGKELTLDILVGFRLFRDDTEVGSITETRDEGSNPLLYVSSEKYGEVIIPYVEQWVIDVNLKNHTLHMDFPEELLHLN